LIALASNEWLVLVIVPVVIALLSQLTLGFTFIRQVRRERRRVPIQERTVAFEEVEHALQVFGDRLDACESRWERHTEICPLWRPRHDRPAGP